jgi:hypothetical protein
MSGSEGTVMNSPLPRCRTIRRQAAAHISAALRALTARLYAIFHASCVLTTLSAGLTCNGAQRALLFVKLGATEHQIRCGLTKHGATDHQPKMLRLRVSPTHLETQVHRCPEALSMATLTVIDAIFRRIAED